MVQITTEDVGGIVDGISGPFQMFSIPTIAFGRVKRYLIRLRKSLNQKMPSTFVAFSFKKTPHFATTTGTYPLMKISSSSLINEMATLAYLMLSWRETHGTGLHSQRLEKTRWTTRGEIGRRAESKEIDFGETLNWAYLYSHRSQRGFVLNAGSVLMAGFVLMMGFVWMAGLV